MCCASRRSVRCARILLSPKQKEKEKGVGGGRRVRYDLLPRETWLSGIFGPNQPKAAGSNDLGNKEAEGGWYKGTGLWQPSVHSDVAV